MVIGILNIFKDVNGQKVPDLAVRVKDITASH